MILREPSAKTFKGRVARAVSAIRSLDPKDGAMAILVTGRRGYIGRVLAVHACLRRPLRPRYPVTTGTRSMETLCCGVFCHPLFHAQVLRVNLR